MAHVIRSEFEGLIPPSKVRALISSWLAEDAPSFDVGGYVVGGTPTSAVLYAKSDCVVAGNLFVDTVFAELGCEVQWYANGAEGTRISCEVGEKVELGVVSGPATRLLQGERVALNAFAECSAIALAARTATGIAERVGWKGRIAGTRKTTPGFRLVQKYGMVVGGMDTHRMDLSSMVMLKDNHINVTGSITKAVQKARRAAGFSVKIDVECGSVEEAREAAQAGAEVVMLDNFKAPAFVEAAKTVKEEYPHVLIEGSGGITLESISHYMVPEADVLSFSVNRYVQPVDMSMKIVKD